MCPYSHKAGHHRRKAPVYRHQYHEDIPGLSFTLAPAQAHNSMHTETQYMKDCRYLRYFPEEKIIASRFLLSLHIRLNMLRDRLVMFLAVLHCSLDKSHENRLRMFRGALEFRMELDTDEERMRWYLDYLHKTRLRIAARSLHPGLLDKRQVVIVELVSVPVALGYQFLPVYLYPVCKGILVNLAVVCTETHCTAFNGRALLILHQVYDRDRRRRVYLR